MKKIILIISLIQCLAYSDFKNVNLKDYITFISKEFKQTFLIDTDLSKDITILVDQNIKKHTYKQILKTALNNQGFELIKNNNFYFIQEKDTYKDNIYYIKLNYLNLADIKEYLSFMNTTHGIIKKTNTLYLKTHLDNYKKIKTHIKNLDTPPLQKKIKINILEIDTSRIINKQLDLITGLKKASILGIDFILEFLSNPFSTSSNFSSNQVNAVFTYLNEKGYTKIISSPTLTIRHNEPTSFNIINNVPYLTGDTTDTDTNTIQNNISYKDVGLQIDLKSLIFDKYIDLDISLKDSSIINNSNTPTTSSKSLKQKIILENNETFFLTGFEKVQNSNTKGYIFNSNKTKSKKSLLITLQIIN